MIRTFNYIAAILVVFFGLWLFSGSNRQYLPATTVNDVADATSEIQSVSEPHYRNALSREMPMDFPDSQDVAHQSSAAVNSSRFAAGSDQEPAGTLQLPAEKAGRIVVAENNPVTDAVSDASWFSGLVNRAREIGDRIINIEISGSTDKGVAGESADIA
ncbi:MAG: hypothetical protein QG652_633, partial [Pseudomonadota bacterium]|nr:hypothetical protein [Pseudomonadota bacterium]